MCWEPTKVETEVEREARSSNKLHESVPIKLRTSVGSFRGSRLRQMPLRTRNCVTKKESRQGQKPTPVDRNNPQTWVTRVYPRALSRLVRQRGKSIPHRAQLHKCMCIVDLHVFQPLTVHTTTDNQNHKRTACSTSRNSATYKMMAVGAECSVAPSIAHCHAADSDDHVVSLICFVLPQRAGAMKERREKKKRVGDDCGGRETGGEEGG